MHFDNQIRPYFVCGGFPKDDSWFFFTPYGEVQVEGCNRALEIMLPLCNGWNHLGFIKGELEKKFSKKEVEELFNALFHYLILVDSNRIFQIFYAYSKNPMPFFEIQTREETYDYVVDQSHIPPISERCFKAQFAKIAVQVSMNLRCSTRDFSGESMSEGLVFALVWSAYGKQDERKDNESYFLERTFTVPSGGALYPLFIYLILFKRGDSLEKGIYLWHKEKDLLELVTIGDFLAVSEEIIYGIPSLKEAVGILCVVADFERSAKKYGNKAYNLIQQEVGHVMQNVALFCAEADIGVVEIGGYDDEDMALLLGIQFPVRAPLIVAAFGKKRR